MVPVLDRCPSALVPGYNTYSPSAKKELFDSRTKKVSHVLSIDPPGKDPEQTKILLEKRARISISGVQEKYSMTLEKDQLIVVDKQGHYILKPAPGGLVYPEHMPANEHVTMQIAKQVFKINTAANGIVFFNDGTPAYITRRFDYKPDGTKYQVEDFASLLGRTEEKEGEEYKYNASYEDIGRMIKKYVPAYPVEMVKFYRLVIFNYLFANGDAHLKNFSVIESKDGDYILAPAYDLMCTQLHINDAGIALNHGLFEGCTDTPSFKEYGHYTYQSFVDFGTRLGIPLKVAQKTIDSMITGVFDASALLVDRSFLPSELREQYILLFHGKMQQLKKTGGIDSI